VTTTTTNSKGRELAWRGRLRNPRAFVHQENVGGPERGGELFFAHRIQELQSSDTGTGCFKTPALVAVAKQDETHSAVAASG